MSVKLRERNRYDIIEDMKRKARVELKFRSAPMSSALERRIWKMENVNVKSLRLYHQIHLYTICGYLVYSQRPSPP